jgi:hypothetical protein
MEQKTNTPMIKYFLVIRIWFDSDRASECNHYTHAPADFTDHSAEMTRSCQSMGRQGVRAAGRVPGLLVAAS